MTSTLRPEDLVELRALSLQLENDMDALSYKQREGIIRRIREGLATGGTPFTADDERISALWLTSGISVGDFVNQFGERISRLSGK
jgi:hypothetical protein